jgi:4-amino-4-deoxy-L-arabinose transferase and related glycosyltransferases of PMT family
MSTLLSNSRESRYQLIEKTKRRIPLFTTLGLLALLLIALIMRMYTLNAHFDRDSYDEGVYWQTLRALGSGHPLYSSTFYAQPPMFILSIFPTYMLAGQTIWAARLGVVLISLLGLLGAFILGYALHGRWGGFIALGLCITSQAYLAASQTLQAEGPQVAFTLLAIAFAYLWWQHPGGWKGNLYAALCTLTLVISTACKLTGILAAAPIVLLVLAQLWRTFQWPLPRFLRVLQYPTTTAHDKSIDASEENKRVQVMQSLIIGIAVLLVTTLFILLPYLGDFHAFWSQVVSFHSAATGSGSRAGNSSEVLGFLFSPLGVVAFIGLIVACYRRDWRVLPFLVWLIVSSLFLWRQVPLFAHHLVILVPTLIGLSVFALDEQFLTNLLERPSQVHFDILLNAIQSTALFFMLCTLIFNIYSDINYYHQMNANAASSATYSTQVIAQQLQQVTQPSQYVITDAQFLSALANRNTLPALVDTSSVHIQTGYLTADQLIADAQQPQVQAVLFYTGRLSQLPAFHTWVAQHYHLVHDYGKGKELWVKIY